MGGLWSSWFLSWALDYVFRGKWARRQAQDYPTKGWLNAECQLKTLGHLSVHFSSTIQSKHRMVGLAKDIHSSYLEAMSTVWWCQFHLQANKVLNTPRDHLKKGAKRENVEVPTYLLSDTHAHWPWHVYAGSTRRQWETVGERKRRVLAREKELTVSCKLCITRYVSNTFHAPQCPGQRGSAAPWSQTRVRFETVDSNSLFLPPSPSKNHTSGQRPVKV